MKSIGLIGGLSYVSTIEYYRYINELANEKLGGNEASRDHYVFCKLWRN